MAVAQRSTIRQRIQRVVDVVPRQRDAGNGAQIERFDVEIRLVLAQRDRVPIAAILDYNQSLSIDQITIRSYQSNELNYLTVSCFLTIEPELPVMETYKAPLTHELAPEGLAKLIVIW